MRSLIDNKQLCRDKSTTGFTSYIPVSSADEVSISVTFAPATTGVKLNFKASNDNVNWHNIEGTAMNSGDTFILSTILPQIYGFDISMCTSFLVEVETITTGSVSIFATSFSMS